MTITIAGLQPELAILVQENTLQRVFHDALFPALLFRNDVKPDKWEANVGDTQIFTKTGNIEVDVTPLVPGQDPTIDTYDNEQWLAIANQYGKALFTNMPTSRTTLAPKVLEDTHKLGLNSAQTLNRLIRNRLFQSYLAGNTTAIDTAGSGTFTIHVSNLNGFTETLSNGRPVSVSAANPIPVTFPDSTAVANNVIAASPDNSALPFGAGVVTLSAALSADVTTRHAVIAGPASQVHRVGGGNSVDALTGTDILTLNDIIDSVQILHTNDVPPHPDGFYHCHLNPTAISQIFRDDHWQRLHESLPDSAAYKNLSVGNVAECYHYRNTELPNQFNSGTLQSTGAGSSQGSGQIGGEVINNAGINVGRCIITGGNAIYEKYVDESEYLSEAGVTGKIGQFSITNNGVQVLTERIRFILRAPLDILQQNISQAWSWTGDFPIPSDILTGSASQFKRAVVIEHAA